MERFRIDQMKKIKDNLMRLIRDFLELAEITY